MDRSKEYAFRKAQRIERREQGACTRCGVPLTETELKNGFVTCKRCRDTWRLVYYQERAARLGRRPMQDRGKDGDCWMCGKKLPDGYTKKKCPECIEKSKRKGVRKNG